MQPPPSPNTEMAGRESSGADRFWALLGRARAGQGTRDAVPNAAYAFLGIARGSDRPDTSARLVTLMAGLGWLDITIDHADPLAPAGLPGDESLLAAMREAALRGAAFVIFPEPLNAAG